GVPHRYANDAVQLFDGPRSASLRLPPPLTPGGSSLADLQTALDARREGRVEVVRDRSQVGVRLRLFPTLWLNAQYGLESRHGDVAANLPLRTRAIGAFSWSTSLQNDDLLPPTINDGAIGPIDLSNWNTRAALSRDRAHVRVDDLLAKLSLIANPWQPLRLRA